MNTIVRFESKIEETAECFGFLSEMKLKFEWSKFMGAREAFQKGNRA